MSDIKHTPGPWKCQPHPDNTSLGVYFIYPTPNIGDYAEESANARLIAAAPELLAALKACQLQMLQSNNNSEYAQEANALAVAAIAKAEGR